MAKMKKKVLEINIKIVKIYHQKDLNMIQMIQKIISGKIQFYMICKDKKL